MTTIAYRNGFMASDSKVTAGDFFVTRDAHKVVRLKYGHLLGMSGDADGRDLVVLLQNIRSEKNLPSRAALSELKLEFHALLVFKNGSVYHLDSWMETELSEVIWTSQIQECSEKFAAVGNGHQFAMGAMANGANAAEAVEIACKYDSCSGPPVRVYKLREE